MIKRFILVASILVIFGSFLVFYDFPKSIHLNYQAVEFRTGDPSSVQKTTVHIKGTLTRPLFRNQKFHGRITVDKYNYSRNYQMFDIYFNKVIRNGLGTIAYSDEKPSGFTFGFIWKKGSFDSLKILVFEPNGPDAGGGKASNLQIIAPSNDYESASAIAQQFKE
jgi:hypothetical protein